MENVNFYAAFDKFGAEVFVLAFAVCAIIIFVLKIIGFFNVCGGKAKELPIVRNFDFLK